MNKQLLILDVDETLVHSIERPLDRDCDFQIGPYCIYRRPYLTKFLTTVSEWFECAVWSSAGASYVQAVVEHVFPKPESLRFVWSRDRCTQRFAPEEQSYYWVKDLKKVKRIGYPLKRVLVIDDSFQKLERQYGNHLSLCPFFGDLEDQDLQTVLPFLDHLRGVDNLRAVEKRRWRALVKKLAGEAEPNAASDTTQH